jgi:lysophospholipid acyltransferase (LPLAT)-like uncharacterized protein
MGQHSRARPVQRDVGTAPHRGSGRARRPAGAGARLLACLYAWLLRLQAATWRTEIEGLERLDGRLARGERTLVTCWHGKYVPLLPLLRGREACVFTSQSFRGEIIAGICQHFGYACVQLPRHARDQALALMRQALTAHHTGGIVVDGPRGPYHVVKRGAIQLASELGCALLPVSVASRRQRVLRHRWDRMEIPYPWTRVSLVIGEAMTVPAGLTPDELEPWTRRLHDALEAVDRLAEAKTGSTRQQ